MSHPLVYTLVRIPAAQFKFKKPDFWSTEGPGFAGSPRWDVNIFIVSNAAGLQYVNRDLLLAGIWHASKVIGGKELAVMLPQTRPDAVEPTCPHVRNFSNIQVSPQSHKSWKGIVSQAQFTNCIQPCPKWENAASIWYTDGSATKSKNDGTIIGSGAYCRGKDVSLRLAPCGDGPTYTITRAELVAVYAVVCHVQADAEDCIIATDSKASMQAIHKHILNPMGNQLNTHKTLLDAIAAELRLRALRGLHTSIIKVKSHIGIMGNEMADKLAN